MLPSTKNTEEININMIIFSVGFAFHYEYVSLINTKWNLY